MSNKNIVELGDEVEDTVTGFKGVAVAVTLWLHQCSRVFVQPKVDKDGKHQEGQTFDAPSLKILKKNKVKVQIEDDLKTSVQKRTGGSQNDKAAQAR